MTLREKRDAIVHRDLTEQLMPEWSGISWVKNSAGLAQCDMPRVWDGDGLQVLDELVNRPADELTGMLNWGVLRAAIGRAKSGDGTAFDGSLLRVFTILSVASDLFREMNEEVRKESPADRGARLVSGDQSPPASFSAAVRVRRRIAATLPTPMRNAIRSLLP
jgi:hypothetical protein